MRIFSVEWSFVPNGIITHHTIQRIHWFHPMMRIPEHALGVLGVMVAEVGGGASVVGQ